MNQESASLASRKGMTLVELLGVMVVLVILASLATGGILGGQEKARVASALTAVDAYKDAFSVTCITHPGIAGSRDAAWADEVTYSSQSGLAKLVNGINETVDDLLVLQWDDSLKCYRSTGTDPWGGYYVLLEYPVPADPVANPSYWDPTVAPGSSTFAVAIFATGNNDDILVNKIVGEESYGVGLTLAAGLISHQWHGFNDTLSFTDWSVKLQ